MLTKSSAPTAAIWGFDPALNLQTKEPRRPESSSLLLWVKAVTKISWLIILSMISFSFLPGGQLACWATLLEVGPSNLNALLKC